MQIQPLDIPGAWVLTPAIHGDQRGVFLEWYRREAFAEATGAPLALAQANCSVSSRGVVRGIHFTDVPPGQAKYVTCVHGAVRDVVVDLRVGSATFGRWQAVELDSSSRRVVYLEAGLGHGFCVTSDEAAVVYLVDEGYSPDHERGIHPLDPDLAIDWGLAEAPTLSERDLAAPSLAAAQEAGLLPSAGACRERARRTTSPG